MLTIPYNGEPCVTCGHRVSHLVVNVNFTRNGRQFRANRTMPCGCVHAVEPKTPADDVASELVG